MLRVRNGNVSIGRGETGFLRVSAIRSDGTPYVLPPLPREDDFQDLKAYLRLGIDTDTFVADHVVDAMCDLTEPMKCTVLATIPFSAATDYPIGTFVDNPGAVTIGDNTYNKGFACFETEEIIDKKVSELASNTVVNQVYHDTEKNLYWCAMKVDANTVLAVTYEFNLSIAITNEMLQHLPSQWYVYDICVLMGLTDSDKITDLQYKQMIVPRHTWTIEENTHGEN